MKAGSKESNCFNYFQEIQAKHAAERLGLHLGAHKIGDLPRIPPNYRAYHVEKSDSSSSADEENYPEVHDEEDHDKQGTVVFTVDTIET